MKAHPYAWQCFICPAANPPDATVCQSCGFPARASGIQIEAAREARKQGSNKPVLIKQTSTVDSIANALAPLPAWRKVLAILGGILLTSGLLWLKFLILSFAEIAWSLLAMFIGLAVMGLAYAGVDEKPRTPKSSARQPNCLPRNGTADRK
jgi:hypothetical protein